MKLYGYAINPYGDCPTVVYSESMMLADFDAATRAHGSRIPIAVVQVEVDTRKQAIIKWLNHHDSKPTIVKVINVYGGTKDDQNTLAARLLREGK